MPLKLSRSSLGLKRFTSRITMENEKPNEGLGKTNDVIKETFINHIKFSQSINRLREHLISIMKLGNSSNLNNTTKNNRPFNIAVFTNCFNNDNTNDQNTIQIVKECLRQRMKGVLNRRGYTIVTAHEALEGSTPLMTKNDATHHRWYNFNSSRNIILFGVGTENGDILKITNLMDNGLTGDDAYKDFGLFSESEEKLHHKNFGFGGNVGDSLLSLIHSPFKYTVYLNSNISVFSSKLKQIFFILASQKSGLACVRTNQKDFLKSKNDEYIVNNRYWIANTNGYRTDIIGLDKSNKYALPLLDNVRTNYMRHVRTWYRYLKVITDKSNTTNVATQTSMSENKDPVPDGDGKTFAALYVNAYYAYSWNLITEMSDLDVETFNTEIDNKGSSHTINYQNYYSVISGDPDTKFTTLPSLAENTKSAAEADGYHYLMNNASNAGNISYTTTSPMLANGLEPISNDNVPPRGWVSAISIGYDFQTGSSSSDGYDYFDKDTTQGKAMRSNYVMNDFPHDNVRGQQVLYNALHPFRSTTGAFESSHGASGNIFNNNYHHKNFTGIDHATYSDIDENSSKYVFELPNYTFLDQQDFIYTNSIVSELISKISKKGDITSNHSFTGKTHQLSQAVHMIKQKSGSEDNKPIEKIDTLFQETDDDLRDVNNSSNLTGGKDGGIQATNNNKQAGADASNENSSGGNGGGSNDARSQFQALTAANLAENFVKYENFINKLVSPPINLTSEQVLTDSRAIAEARKLFGEMAIYTDGQNDQVQPISTYKAMFVPTAL